MYLSLTSLFVASALGAVITTGPAFPISTPFNLITINDGPSPDSVNLTGLTVNAGSRVLYAGKPQYGGPCYNKTGRCNPQDHPVGGTAFILNPDNTVKLYTKLTGDQEQVVFTGADGHWLYTQPNDRGKGDDLIQVTENSAFRPIDYRPLGNQTVSADIFNRRPAEGPLPTSWLACGYPINVGPETPIYYSLYADWAPSINVIANCTRVRLSWSLFTDPAPENIL